MKSNTEQVTSITFQFGQIPVAYKKIGEGKPLIVLHGWGTEGKIMLPLAKALSGLRTCYVLDLPGFGKTPPPPNAWTVGDYADLVEQFIDDEIQGPVDILAHSFGGRITLKLCARSENRERIGKVLITGGAGMKPKRSFDYYFKKYLAKTLKAPFMLLPKTLREKGLTNLRKTQIWKSLGSSDYRQLSGVMRETFVKTVTEYLDELLLQIPHEILLLWGQNDDAAPLYQAKRMEKGLKNAALVTIEHSGHYAFLDRPRQFTAIAKAFFEEKSKG